MYLHLFVHQYTCSGMLEHALTLPAIPELVPDSLLLEPSGLKCL